MTEPPPPRFARHAITLASGDRWPVPETRYEIAVPDGGVTTQEFEQDGATSSLVTCRLEVFEDGTRVHTELVATGETAWFRDLEVRVSGAGEDGAASLEIVRAPYTSVPPKPAG